MPLVALLVIVAAFGLLAGLAPTVLQRRATQALIKLVAVVGLYVFVGNSGVLSFGNVAFMAVGAYVSALLTMKPAAKSVFLPDLPAWLATAEWPPFAGALAGGGAAAVDGARRRLAPDAPFRHLGEHRDLRGPGHHLRRARQLDHGHRRAEFADGPAALCRPVDGAGLGTSAAIVVAFLYQETRSALLLRASREDEAAAEAVGVHIVRHRLIAFVISAFLSGIAGVLLAHFLGTVRVETFYLDLTFLIVAMLVIGGMRSLSGAVAGALVIAALTELLRQAEIGITIGNTVVAAPAGLGDAILALLMLAIILFRPKGIAGGREILDGWSGNEATRSRPSP